MSGLIPTTQTKQFLLTLLHSSASLCPSAAFGCSDQLQTGPARERRKLHYKMQGWQLDNTQRAATSKTTVQSNTAATKYTFQAFHSSPIQIYLLPLSHTGHTIRGTQMSCQKSYCPFTSHSLPSKSLTNRMHIRKNFFWSCGKNQYRKVAK